MEKVLIISYYFPPCNLTASQRTLAWTKYLHEFDFYPIILTRKWEKDIKELKDMSHATSKEEEVAENDDHSIIRVPFSGSTKDKIYSKHGDNNWKLIRKFFSLFELIFQNYFVFANPAKVIFYKAQSILRNENSIHHVVITGTPFICFYYGYLLKKEFPHINWIADYRDDWSTTELKKPKSFLEKILFNIEKKSEKKWLNNAAFFTSISDYYVSKIGNFISKKGFVLLNGYDQKLSELKHLESNQNVFTITYNGSLYPSQNIDPFLKSIINLIDEFDNQIKIKLMFPGLGFDALQQSRVENLMSGYEDHFWISERIDRENVIDIQLRSNILLMIGHEGLKGIPGSKLYEYVALKKPVLLYPNDNDIIEQTLQDTGLGIICNTSTELEEKLRKIIKNFLLTNKIELRISEEAIKLYSRRNQTKKLASILEEL